MSGKPDIGSRASTPLGRRGSEGVDGRDKPGHDARRNAGTPENPVKRRDLIVCWQNGRSVLLPASEVARLMTKETPAKPSSTRVDSSISSLPGRTGPRESAVSRGETRQSMRPQRDPNLTMDHRVNPRVSLSARPRTWPGDDGEGGAGGRQNTASHGLTPPYIPRNRSLARNEIWQLLAKRLADHTKHWRSCHAPRCRRAHQCMGGSNACFLREFEAVDEFFQRHLLPHIKRQAEAVKE
jgi:hypothetical protein